MKKFLKKTEGFTLVELIVVIAILGILAAIAIPAYSGYITKANDSAVITELDAIKTAAQAANATAGEIGSISLGTDNKVTIKAAANNVDLAATFKADFATFYEGEDSIADAVAATSSTPGSIVVTLKADTINLTNTSYTTGAKWEATGSNANKWVKN